MRTPMRRRLLVQLTGAAGIALLAACSDDPMSPLPGLPGERPLANESEVQPATAPDNDDFDDAVVVSSLPFSHAVNTSDATTAPDDPDCVGQGPTVWYVLIPSEDATILASTFGSDYDTTLSAYTGTRGDLVQIACNDDTGGLQSSVVVSVTAGEPVYFMVGAFASGPGGNLVFNVDLAPPPLEVSLAIDPFGGVDPRSGVATIRGTFSCSRSSPVDIFGVLRDRIGRARIEAFFGDFFLCEGSGRWQAQVTAQNAYLVGGPVEVEVFAAFWDPLMGTYVFVEESARVRLRGSPHGSRITADGGQAVQLFESSSRSLDEVMRRRAPAKPRW